jgi:hypothetical protein
MGANSYKNKTARSGAGSKPAKKKKKPLKLTVSRTHKPEDLSLEEWQRTLRKEYGLLQRFILKNVGDHPIHCWNSRPNKKPSGTRPWRIGPSNWNGIREPG